MQKPNFFINIFMTPLIIPQQGSNRVYERLYDEQGESYIRTTGTNKAENEAFIYLCRHFEAKGLPVPHIIAVAEDGMSYTQSDLGDTLLFQRLDDGELINKVLRALAHLHTRGAEGLDWAKCYPVPAFDRRSVFWDLNYFKYCYLKLSVSEIDEVRLENDFDTLADYLLLEPFDTFMYRDFQSRNVMIKDNEPYFIDFQGGRKGPVEYDLASFLWQARAHFSQSQRDKWIDVYEQEAHRNINKERLAHFVLFRMLQTLGAYGFRGLIEQKEHFLQSLPIAQKNLRNLFAGNAVLQEHFPYISSL